MWAGWTLTFKPVTAGEYAELDCIKLLADQLPDSFTVFHHLDWHSASGTQDYFGELDIVVTTPSGRVICLEVKAGNLDFSDEGIRKDYGGNSKDVIGQARRQHAVLMTNLRSAGFYNQVGHFLVLPQYRMEGAGTLAYPRERIIDASEYASLPAKLLQLDHPSAPLAKAERLKLEYHLSNRFSVALDVDAADDAESAAVSRLAEGLATWVPRIESPTKTYLIEATAGSGKTQLALSLLNEAVARGDRTLYVCFNRLLAEHMARLAPVKATVDTFHQLCRDAVERSGETIDFSTPGVFEQLAKRFAELNASAAGRYDCIVIDEAQDFMIDWVVAVHALGTGEHRLYVLQDESQNLYGRDAFELDGATVIRSNDNFRSPRKLVELINLLRLSHQPIRACAPYVGETPDVLTYAPGSADSLLTATTQAVQDCLSRGYRPEQIAVLSFVGKERSTVLAQDSLASLRLKRFTGHDQDGNARWSDGELLADTLFRFKGRSAPAIVLTEIDFEQLQERDCRRLFVGITRARRLLKLVVSEQAAEAITARIAA